MVQPDVRFGISHDFAEESMEVKARWFQSLTMEERMEALDSWIPGRNWFFRITLG